MKEEDIKKLNKNADNYIFALGIIEFAYFLKKINKKRKEELTKDINQKFSSNFWKLNPWIKENPILKKIIDEFDLGKQEDGE